MVTEITKGDRFRCKKDLNMNNDPTQNRFITGKVYKSLLDGHLANEKGNYHQLENVDLINEHFEKIYTGDLNVEIPINLPTYYDNSKGSLYKIAQERGWSPYVFDVVKRLDRGGKKDPLRQEIEKSIGVLQLWLKELES